MHIAVVGTGYVGLVTGTCFSEMGNDVYCVDVDEKKIAALNKGQIPIYEPGLSSMVEEHLKNGTLHFTTDIKEALAVCNVCFIAVGTPMGEDGSADLKYVKGVAAEIGDTITRHTYVVDKSTVPVGTAKMVRETIQAGLDKRGLDITFDVISNPEFLKEGTAVSDCMRPDRIVVGIDNEKALEVMRELYLPYVRNTENFIYMDIASAEMTKYAANSMLAAKISFMNEIANICERVGADVNKVRLGMGSDRRIGYSFIYAGCGYGGSCFPKDVEALVKTSAKNGYKPQLLEAISDVNDRQKIVKRYGEDLTGKTFAVWGLAFKPDTDDMREATSVVLINELTKGNDGVEYFDSKYDALNDADALVLVTEWREFRSPDFGEMKKRLKEPVFFDGRNQFDRKRMKETGFEYHQIGVGE